MKKLIILMVLLTFAGCVKRPGEGAFVYGMEELKKVPPAMIGYKEVMRHPLKGIEPHSLWASPEGELFITAPERVVKLNTRGEITARFRVEGLIRELVSRDGKIFFAAREKNIEIYDTSFRLLRSWPETGEKGLITSLALTRDYLFAADSLSRIVFVYSEGGKLLALIDGKEDKTSPGGFIVPSPVFDLATRGDDKLWIVNPGTRSLGLYTGKGTFRESWRKTGSDLEGFAGCCNPVNIALLSDGSIVTVEKGLLRVKVYSPRGQLITVVAGGDSFSPGSDILDLAVGPGDRVWVLDRKDATLYGFEKKS